MTVQRLLPTPEAEDLLGLVREIADGELAPRVAEFEARKQFPREVFRLLGRSGLLGLPYPEEFGGGAQPYEVYLQVLEEIAARWLAIAEGMSVHTLACYPVFGYGTETQRKRHLPDLIGGELPVLRTRPVVGGDDLTHQPSERTVLGPLPAPDRVELLGRRRGEQHLGRARERLLHERRQLFR